MYDEDMPCIEELFPLCITLFFHVMEFPFFYLSFKVPVSNLTSGFVQNSRIRGVSFPTGKVICLKTGASNDDRPGY